MEKSFKNPDAIQTFWQKRAEDPECWHEAAFARFPSVIAHEYKRLQDELRCGRPFAALLQIKDVMEAVLKFEVLLACAWASEQPLTDFKEKVGCLITTRNLSLGAWMELARRVVDFFKSAPVKMPPVLLKPLKAVRSYYNKKDFVNWRNETVGHGALAFDQNEEFQQDIAEKLKQLHELFQTIDSDLCRQTIHADGGRLLLTGCSLARNLKISDPTILFKNQEEALFFTVSPYMLVWEGAVFFFDNQKKPLRTQRLCYTTGGRRDEENKYFTQLDNLRESQNLRLELPAESNYMSADEENFLNRLGLAESFVEPAHLTGWLRAQINEREKGIYLLKMPRGTGKSSFAEKLNCLYKKPLRLDEDTDVRTYHISRTQLRSGADFERGIETQWQFAYEGSPWTGYMRISEYIAEKNTPAQALAAFLEQAQRYTDYRRGCERILMVIDGLDEIAADEIWNYIPSEDMLCEGVHILLTSRDPEAEGDLPHALFEHLAKIDVQSSLTVRKDSEQNIQFLKAYAKKEVKLDEQQMETIIGQAEYRVLYLAMYCELLKGGLTMKELPAADKLCARYVGELQKQYGEKKTHELHSVLSVLSTVGQFEPLSLSEIAELAGFGAVTFNLLGVINDIRTLLKAERGFGAGEQRYAGENRYVFANPDVAKMMFEQIPSAKQMAKDAVLRVIEELVRSEEGTQMSDAMLAVFAHAAELLEMGGVPEADYPRFEAEQCGNISRALNAREDNNYVLTLERLKKCYWQAIHFAVEKEKFEQSVLYLWIGRIFSKLCESDKAIQYYQHALRIQEELYVEGDATNNYYLSICYKNLAIELSYRGEREQAIYYTHKGLEVQEKLYTRKKLSDPNDLATTYDNLGCLLEKQGNVLQAVYYHKKALEIQEELCKNNELGDLNSLADTYNNIAGAFDSQGDFEQAFLYYKKALEIREKLHQEGRLFDVNDLAFVYNNLAYTLANVSNSQYDIKQAIFYYSKAVEIQEKLYEIGRLPKANDLATVYSNLASALDSQGNLQQSVFYCRKAVEIQEGLYKIGRLSSNEGLARTYNNLASALDSQGDVQQAVFYYNKALEIQRKLYDEGRLICSEDLAAVYSNLSVLFYSKRNFPKTLSYLHEERKILEELYKENRLSKPNTLVDTYNSIAGVLISMGRRRDAHIYIKKAQNLLKK